MTPLFTEKGKCEVDLNNEKKNKLATFMEYPAFIVIDPTHFIYSTWRIIFFIYSTLVRKGFVYVWT